VDVSISITVGDIPDFYWVAVPARRFLSADIHVIVVDDGPDIRRVIERTEYVGAPRITNNIVVNNVIDVDVVAEITGQEVKTVEVRETDDPRQASASGDDLTVFRSEVAREENARPKEVKEVNEVKKVKRSGEEGEAAGTEPIPEPDAAQDTTAAPEGEAEQPAAKAAGETGGEQQPAQQAEEQPEQGQPKQQAEEQPEQGQSKRKQPAQKKAEEEPEQGQPEQQPAKKQAKEQPAQAEPEQQPAQQQAEEQPDEPADEATGTTSAPEEEAQGQGKASGEKQNRGQQKKECDPAADPECAPAQ
jgi:hypothetical protein